MPAPRPAPEMIEFTADDRGRVVAVMRRLLRDRDGWINLQPAVEPDDVPDPDRRSGRERTGRSSIGRLFSARGPMVPLATWIPGAKRRNGTFEPVSLGLQHAGGPKALLRLRDEGHPRLDGWRVLTDHPRRGMVIAVPDDEDPDLALAWVIEAAVRLTPFELPTTWLAGVFAAR